MAATHDHCIICSSPFPLAASQGRERFYCSPACRAFGWRIVAAASSNTHGSHDHARRLVCRAVRARNRVITGSQTRHAERVVNFLLAAEALIVARRAIRLAKSNQLLKV